MTQKFFKLHCFMSTLQYSNTFRSDWTRSTIEDTATTFEELEREFGLSVANIVKECSDDKSLAKDERKKQQIEHAAHASQKAKLVKLADKLYNLSDLLQAPPPSWYIVPDFVSALIETHRWIIFQECGKGSRILRVVACCGAALQRDKRKAWRAVAASVWFRVRDERCQVSRPGTWKPTPRLPWKVLCKHGSCERLTLSSPLLSFAGLNTFIWGISLLSSSFYL